MLLGGKVRDDELRRALSDANPWWAAAAAGRDPTAWHEANRTLRDRRQFDLGYRSGILDDIASGPPDGSLVILTGPRRAGKTVALLDAALSLCGCRGTGSAPDVDPGACADAIGGSRAASAAGLVI